MDPTLNHIVYKDSFDTSPTESSDIVLEMYTNDVAISTPINYSIKKIQFNPAPLYVSTALKKSLVAIKKGYAKYAEDSSNWLRLRSGSNPFELRGNSVFINRAAVKLANIDAIYHLIPDVVTGRLYAFGDVAGGPGGFSQYILFRYPSAMGFGITLTDPKSQSLAWDLKVANSIDVILGQDGTGDLFKYSGHFAEEARRINGDGLNLIVADGAIGGNEENPNQEVENFGLIVAECRTALLGLKEGGHFVCKIFEAETKPMGQLIYLLSLCFDQIDICKPISSRPGNAERYFVGLNFKETKNAIEISTKLNTIIKELTKNSDSKISKIFDNEMPDAFVQWLTKKNNIHTDLQITIGHYMDKVAKGETIPKYNMYNAYGVWNIPSDSNDPYQVVTRKKVSYKRPEQAGIEPIDTLIYKELQRLYLVNKIKDKIVTSMKTVWTAGGNAKSSASALVSMYMFDHLIDKKYHALDPILPSGTFHPDARYGSYLRHISKNAVTEQVSASWFKGLNFRHEFESASKYINNLGLSKFPYTVTKSTHNSKVSYSCGKGTKAKTFSITEAMDRKLINLLSPQVKGSIDYSKRANEYIFLLLLRYFGTLDSRNHQLGIPDYDVVSPLFNIQEELFASPMNNSLGFGHYHSAFPDTDKPFGSLGPFQETIPISGFGYSVNPPYAEITMTAAMDKVVEWLKAVPNILFYITIPIWDQEGQESVGIKLPNIYGDYPALNIIRDSGFVKYTRSFNRDDFVYIDHNTHTPTTPSLIHASNTYIIIASNRELRPEELKYMESR